MVTLTTLPLIFLSIISIKTATTTTTAFFLRPPLINHQQQRLTSSPSSHDKSKYTKQYEKPQWLNDAMGDDSSSPNNNDYIPPSKLSPGISGFAIDPTQGFVAILTSSSTTNEQQQQRFITVLVSTQDKGSNQVESAEALTLVQLAGGLDLGTAILPPDTLLNLVREELEADEEDEDFKPRVTLTKITVMPNDDDDNTNNETKANDKTKAAQPIKTTPERDAAIKTSSPKVHTAIQKLPNLSKTTLPQVQNAMQTHATSDGSLDREGFTQVLNDLRQEINAAPVPKYKFVLEVHVLHQESMQMLEISSSSWNNNVVQCLGLSMRHKVLIEVDSACFDQEEGGGENEATVENVYRLYPAFRPVQELYEDAKVMDGFIPSMFQQAKKQQQQQQQRFSDDEENGGGFE